MSRKPLFTAPLIPPLMDATRRAGALIMTFYRGGHAVESKEDASPVTEADRSADRLIVDALKRLTPSIPVVSEEGEKPEVTGQEYFWLVDPLDGTKSFVRGKGYFTVNIGLIRNGTPLLGIVYDPVDDAMYWGSDEGAYKNGLPIRVRAVASPPVAYISHSHIDPMTQDYLNARGVTERIPCASSIKLCFLAESKADLYPRFGPTMEWDTAAGHAVLAAAGGRLETPEGAPFIYGKKGFLNGSFIASGR